MNTKANMSYREVIPKNISPEEWIEVEINTGTQSTLQDIKTFGKSGSYCYNFLANGQNRNRFIYWRTYQDVVELSEVSLDISLLKNHLRLRFTDSAVLNVSLSEQANTVTLLVVTVSSVHRIVFPLQSEASSVSVGPADFQRNSIFYDANANNLKDRSTFYVLDGTMAISVPHLAASDMSENSQEAYFAVDYHSKLMLYIMNCRTGSTVSHEVKESHLMPRFLTNLKGALTGRGEHLEGAISMAFSRIDGEVFLLVLYRNNELRLWSVSTLQSVASYSCTEYQGAQGPQNSLLRKIDDHNFCVFLSHEKDSEFICFSIVCKLSDMNTKTVGLAVRHKVPAPQMDLADFDATFSHIWTLWSNAEGDFNVSAIFLDADSSIKWVSAALEPPPDRYCLTIEQGVDPRETYCSYIFHPGRFDRNVIAKALYMFRRVNMQFDIKQLTMGMLKEQVCQTVEDEIQNELKDFVVSDDEYLEIATRLWDRFYSCCEQYHIKFSEPTGLSVLGAMDAVCVIRRQSFALLRPCEMLEHLMLVGENTRDVAEFVAPYCRDDLVAAHGFIELMEVINLLEKFLSEDIKLELDKKIYQRNDSALTNLLIQITKGDDNIDDNNGINISTDCVEQIRKKLQSINIVDAAINMLLDLLAIVDEDAYPDSAGGQAKSTRFLQSTGALFGSEYGISILAETVKQMALIRFAVCRNLLILQYILYGNVSKSDYTIMTNINFLHSYYTLVWISETPISLNTPVNFEVSIQRLTRAQLFSGYTRPYSSQIRLNNQTTLLCLFLQSKGLFSALSMLLKEPNSLVDQLSMRQTLLQLVGCINQMLWPEAWNDVFPEWLFGTCHHIIIQDYERLLAGWCSEKADSRSFMLAVSLLDCGEPQKAIHLFEQVQESVLREPLLFEQVLKNTPIYTKLAGILNRQKVVPTKEEAKLALVHYYLKVIQLFEQHSAFDYIIQLAHIAMNKLHVDDQQLPMFQSIVFNNHLQLGHYEEAYHALVYNADTSRRKDCLRQLVIMLFQCKRFDLLMQLPYNGLQEEFENIVESRARSLSIDQNEVYNFLYAFHANKGNMRKAATVMYEQAMRLQVDSDAPDALQKRCSSLLVCINCLYLVDNRYRWIAKPTIGDEKVATDQTNNEQRSLETYKTHEVVVLELTDIRRELLHAEALRELAHHRKDVAAYEMAGAEELSYLLATCGLYTAALKLARGHAFSVLPIFESLAAACVSTTEDKTKDAWAWLQNNDLADLAHRNSAADMAWSLLQKLVVDNELNESTSIRKCVVNRILTLNAFVPQWLYDSYKLANSRELLHLLVKHNRLLDAADLACEMIGGMLGAGSEYFDFKHSVNVTNPQLAFPINTIDLLLHGLQVNGSKHIEYEMAHVKLEEEVARYIETVKRTTDDKMKLAILTDRENRQQQQIFG
ncbi:nuclear pore complex protein Nup160 homolog [Drosophila novamexicana]|uniref:nuclear pore complex protein Nup160 homolog n=1 Tax=Drosophila novamexicana TaxID=47314 RepID=UPI0011E5DC9A|nr:nuclear pore complex protein Nup160 homolog [Drosophila novamexicana]